ncbi:unnamed protein product, partial [Brassica rapa subsp. trilocularis]
HCRRFRFLELIYLFSSLFNASISSLYLKRLEFEKDDISRVPLATVQSPLRDPKFVRFMGIFFCSFLEIYSGSRTTRLYFGHSYSMGRCIFGRYIY